MTRLDAATVEAWLVAHPAWRHDAGRGAVTRDYAFTGFEHAFAFMSAVALRAQVRDHHPEWQNVSNRVTVTWTTHDVDGLSTLDLEMARFADDTAAALAAT